MSCDSRPGANAPSIHGAQRAIVQIFLEHCEACYRMAGNPLHAWSAYRLARVCEVEIPAWVLAVLDEWRERRRRFQPQLLRKARTDARDWAIIERIFALQQRPTRAELEQLARAHGLDPRTVADPGDRSKLDIDTQVAEEYELSVDRVQAIWSKWTRR